MSLLDRRAIKTKSSAATVAAGENAGALTEAIGDAFTACTYQLGQ